MDVHFTSACDNQCSHCIDTRYFGTGIKNPDSNAIAETIIKNQIGYEDVLFLGGEPCLFLDELIKCVEKIKANSKLKLFVTTAVPKICSDKKDLFIYLISMLDGINLSVQHHVESVADEIRKTKSQYNRQEFYRSLAYKEKIRINLNIVKPYLFTKDDISNCITHYDNMGFPEIKLSEIQHGKNQFVSFEKTFGIKLGSPFYYGCQTFIKIKEILPNVKAKLLLKRSCFMCEKTLSASLLDGVKACYKVFNPSKNNYGVVYENGTLEKGWK
jgi:organic radical activating enzyme